MKEPLVNEETGESSYLNIVEYKYCLYIIPIRSIIVVI